MTEEDRDFVRKCEKFRLVTLSFYGPAEFEQYQIKEEEKAAAAKLSATVGPVIIENDKESMKTMASSVQETKKLNKVSKNNTSKK